MVPKKCFLTSGVGKHEDELFSFELALRDAGIEGFNLIPVSSIFPPNCELVTREEGLKYLSSGEIVFVVMARDSTHESGKTVSASVGLAYWEGGHGYLTEYSGKSGEYAERMARDMLKSKFGISDDEIRSTNISISAVSSGLWTTVVAAAVFIL